MGEEQLQDVVCKKLNALMGWHFSIGKRRIWLNYGENCLKENYHEEGEY